MPRLFTGLEIPAHVASQLSGLRGGLSGARWINPENYHLTLRFVGDIDDKTANEVADMLARVQRPAFTLAFDGLGAFGSRQPRAVYASVPPNPELAALQAENERLIRAAGLPPEGRKFTPHVTLARLRDTKRNSLGEYLAARGDFLSTPFQVTRFVLFSAQPSRGGGPYLVEEAYPLAPAEQAAGIMR